MRSGYIFCFVIIVLIKRLNKRVEIFILIILFYIIFINICLGFMGSFLSALLLLKIIVNVKRCYVGVFGYIEKYVAFVCVLFLKC